MKNARTMYDRWCHASIVLDKSYSQCAYNTTPGIDISRYIEAERRQRDKILAKYGGRRVWRVSPSLRRKSDGEPLTETNLFFTDGSQGYWMSSALTPDLAAIYYGANNQVE